MKKYIFFYRLNQSNNQFKEHKIEARGMLEALVKAKQIKEQIEAETSSDVNLQFRGVVY